MRACAAASQRVPLEFFDWVVAFCFSFFSSFERGQRSRRAGQRSIFALFSASPLAFFFFRDNEMCATFERDAQAEGVYARGAGGEMHGVV